MDSHSPCSQRINSSGKLAFEIKSNAAACRMVSEMLQKHKPNQQQQQMRPTTWLKGKLSQQTFQEIGQTGVIGCKRRGKHFTADCPNKVLDEQEPVQVCSCTGVQVYRCWQSAASTADRLSDWRTDTRATSHPKNIWCNIICSDIRFWLARKVYAALSRP